MRTPKLLSFLSLTIGLFASTALSAQTTVTIGTETSSSSTRGPFQRSDAGSSSVHSRANLVYTQAEMNDAGLSGGEEISQINWWNHSGGNIIDATGDAVLQVYMRNTSNPDATVDSTWIGVTTGSTLVGTYTFNTTNNFLEENGWQEFVLDAPYIYSGGSLEIAVQWDCSGLVSTNADPNLLFTGNGALKWRWSPTTNVSLAVRPGVSAPPSTFETSSHFKSERANIQITYEASGCPSVTGLSASNMTTTSADFSWMAANDAVSYDWLVVESGQGSSGTAIASGNTSNTDAMATGLAALTSYDLYVETDCGGIGTSNFSGPIGFLTLPLSSEAITVGAGTSSSSTRGPIQRSDIGSSTVFSRFHQVYTADELAAAGLQNGSVLTALNWELASENIMIGDGNATWKVYIKNSSATLASAGTWDNLVTGSDLVVDHNYNTNNNFPGVIGWMGFNFSAPFIYTGGALEISVDWDCSQVSTPAFDGDGSLKWRWETTATGPLVAKRTASSSSPTDIDDLIDDRSNIQFVYDTGTVGVWDIDEMTNFSISPNPTNGLVLLELEVTNSVDIDIAIYSVTGELIETHTERNISELRHQLDLQSFYRGVYFVQLSINGQTTTKKVIVTQ